MKFNLQKLIVILVLISNTILVAQELPRFKDGDNIALIGDSITHGGAYPAFLQFFNATQFPNEKVNYYNGGVSGDDCSGTLKRLEKDILIHKPNHAIIMLGMNDIGRWLYPVKKNEVTSGTLSQREQILQKYISNMSDLASRLKNNNVKIIFMTPSIYDQTAKISNVVHLGINEGLIGFGEEVKKLAAKYNAPLVDLNSAMLQVNKKLQKKDKSATIVGHDRIHPGDKGHLVMAYEIIKSAFPVKYTSKIEIDAETSKVLQKENCEVVLKNGIKEFAVLEKALPFALEESLYPTLSLIENNKEYAQEILAVTNLEKGEYTLKIDDVSVGTYSQKDLEKGVDLSLNTNTPQYQQSQKVYQLCFDYKNTNKKLRTFALVEYKTLKDFKGPNTIKAKRAFLDKSNESQKGKPWYGYGVKITNEYFELLPKKDSLWSELSSIRDKIYKSNKPVEHIYSLIKK